MREISKECKGKRHSSSLQHTKLIEQALGQPGETEPM